MSIQGLPDRDAPAPLQPHPLVIERKKNRLDAAGSPTILIGFPDEAEAGRQRLYLNPRLDSYVEFDVEDICESELIYSEDSSLEGYQVTRVVLKEKSSIKGRLILNPKELPLDLSLLPEGVFAYCPICHHGDPGGWTGGADAAGRSNASDCRTSGCGCRVVDLD